MALVNSAFTVNVTPGAMPPTVHVSEYDIGRTYTVTINGQNGSAFNIPTGTTATVEGTLNGVIGFTTGATISGSNVSFTLTESMTARSGKAWCKIKLTLNDEPIQTCAFILAVDRAGVEAETVIGADGFNEQIQDAVDNYLEEHPVPTVTVDPTLTISGAAADAKVTGDEIDELKSAIEDSIDKATWELRGYVDTKGDYTWVIGDCNNYGGYTPSATRILLNEGNSSSHAETEIYVKSSNPDVTFYVNERDTASGIMTGSGWVSEYTIESGKYFRITVRSTPEATITDAETSTEYQAISMNVLATNKVFPKGYYPIKVVAQDGSAEFSTIQSAIDAAKDGDIIYIKNGWYEENVVNTKQIVVIGQDKESTVLFNATGEYATPPLWTCSGRWENLTIYAWNRDNKSFDSLTKLGYSLHLDQKWDSVHSRRHIEIRNCIFKSDFNDCIGCGIDEDGYIEISDTICEATHRSGMKVHPFPVAGGTSKMVLKNNVFKKGVDDNAYGLMFHTGGTDNVNFNTVHVEAYNNIAKTYDGWNTNCFFMDDYNYGNTLAGMNRFSLS